MFTDVNIEAFRNLSALLSFVSPLLTIVANTKMLKLWLILIFVTLVLCADEQNESKEKLEPESTENDRTDSTTKKVTRTTRKFDDFKLNNGTQTTAPAPRVKTQAQINKFVSWKVNL